MIQFVHGNIFHSQMQTIVNTVNCVGVMGKGIALAFREKYPAMYQDYQRKCEEGKVKPGKLSLYTDTEPWVMNFPTKRHWRAKSRLDDIEAGLQALATTYGDWGITSIAMPALGCGHGGLEWSQVKPLIEKYLGSLNIDVEVYEPGYTGQNDLDSTVDLVSNHRLPEVWRQPSLFE